jgi:hypothetical protein
MGLEYPGLALGTSELRVILTRRAILRNNITSASFEQLDT